MAIIHILLVIILIFNISSSTIILPVSQKVTTGIAILKTYFEENSGKVLNVTGYYTSDETNQSAFPTIGLARANTIKNHLVENGISSSQINTFDKLMNSMLPKKTILTGAVSFALTDESDTAAAELSALYDKIEKDPLVLYFNSAQTSINLNDKQRQKLVEISRYLDKVKGATCSLVGHSDNIGAAAINLKVGQERANFAMNYLTKNGIPPAKVTATSKGETEPIASNSTADGRAKKPKNSSYIK